MYPLNPLFAVIIYSIAFFTAYLLNLRFPIVDNNNRNEGIDGLRGFLALGVFIHHSAIWYQYLQINSWETPKSNLYNQLGKASVSLFFMITAYLFVSKLLNSKNKSFNWDTFFISRIFRLFPMYLVSFVTILVTIFYISNWQIKVKFVTLIKSIFFWIAFTIPGNPEINESIYTKIINAGVVWSLPYEWLFYFSLPIISIFIFRKISSKFYIAISVIYLLVYLKFKNVELNHILSFVGGAIAPFIIKYGSKKINYNSFIFSIIILASFMLIPLFKNQNNIICKLLLVLIFNLIVLGNTIFGILKSTTLKFLGEISYSTYLIHGIIIFLTMYFFIGLETAKTLSPFYYCLSIFFITPFVVILSYISYIKIEKPFMDYSKKINIESIKKSIWLNK
jgi:peptidoglycan/LPS O-acetylase OafA/YrhL